MFHLRPANPSEDFLLLAPLDPYKELGDYRAFEGQVALFFCKTCGGRCFLTGGKGELVDIDLEEWKSQGATSGGAKTKAWRVKKDSPRRDGRPPYLSVNAHSIEVDQGLDMRALTKSGFVEYMDCRRDGEDTREARYDYPHDGGSF